MDEKTMQRFEPLEGKDKALQMEAFLELKSEADKKVDWAYDMWDELVLWLTDKDNHRRSRGAQLLAGLAAHSDPEDRILDDFSALWQVTKDEKTVTARHSLQAIWKVALGGDEQRKLLLSHLEDRFKDDMQKHHTLVRYDIIVGLRELYIRTGDEGIKDAALSLIELEEDSKYKKKYRAAWK
ncbi:hypothetical protein [Alteribacter keqinensis]|uniref:HEAT repeat domain-containing protein n=1 Tax=Alteribacter keqinensis TaxID=2483800 RepID=A0A3M7TZ79_9BACI|nr:hypothetical protein [Alteribacter keqinensis]RNA70074.1 hypothetical protein EBO34_09140 [Alteribacter keqinensis]